MTSGFIDASGRQDRSQPRYVEELSVARVRKSFLPLLCFWCAARPACLVFAEHADVTEVFEKKILTLKARLNSTVTERESLQECLDATLSEMEVRETRASSVNIEVRRAIVRTDMPAVHLPLCRIDTGATRAGRVRPTLSSFTPAE